MEQGSVLRQIASNLDEGAVLVSIPLEQGSVLRQREISATKEKLVSIPLEQGSVLRQQWGHQALCDKACRSHFPTFSETQRVGA